MTATIWPAPGAPAAPAGDVFATATAPKPGTTRGVDLAMTDPATYREIFAAVMNSREAGEVIESVMKAKMQEYGIGNLERKYLAIPETDTGGKLDLQSRILGTGGYKTRDPLHECMDQWFRFVLFGREIKHEIVKRAMSIGSDPAGGYVVPPGFIAEIIGPAPKMSGLYQFCRRIPVNTSGGGIPNLATDVDGFWGEENTAMDETQPVLGKKDWLIHRLNALVKLSRELANDSSPNIVDYVIGLLRLKIVELRDKAVAIGTGDGQPLGLFSADGITDVTAPTEVDYDFMVSMHESVDQAYFASPGLRWSFNQATKQRVMKIKDDQGRPLIVLDPTDGFTPRLFGHPVSVETHFPNNFMFFGDLQYYLVFDRETLGVERSTEAGTAFEAHQLWIKFFERWDGLPVPLTIRNPLARCKNIPAHTSEVN